MCGRFSFIVTQKKQKIQQQFKLKTLPSNLVSRYNAAPSQDLAVITNDKQDEISFLRWGLIPTWAKDKNIGYKMINARAETLTQKPSFKTLIYKRRCLVLADGFYEWKKTKSGKIPYRVTLKDGATFGLAGLWTHWKDEGGQDIKSFTIITTNANSLVKKLHDRMPVMLTPDQKDDWLNVQLPQDDVLKMLKPISANQLTMYSVSDLVNSPKNDVAQVIARV